MCGALGDFVVGSLYANGKMDQTVRWGWVGRFVVSPAMHGILVLPTAGRGGIVTTTMRDVRDLGP